MTRVGKNLHEYTGWVREAQEKKKTFTEQEERQPLP